MKPASRLSSLVFVCCALLNQGLFAQVLEEVVVTAQRKEQLITDVSINVSAMTGDSMRALGISDTRDIDGYISNVDIKLSAQGDVNPAITVRGVGLNNFNSNNNPSVGVYVDEVFLSSPSMLTLFMMDVERLEVLKGPQGTLYGRNSSGGAINIHSAKPTQELDGFAEVSGGNYDTLKFEGAVGKGLGDNLAGRVSLYYENQGDSFFEDTLTGEDVGDNERFGVRTQLAYDSDNASANLGVFYFDQNGANQLPQMVGTYGGEVNNPDHDPNDPDSLATLSVNCPEAQSILNSGGRELAPGVCPDGTGAFRETDSDPHKNALDPAFRDRLQIDTDLFGTTFKFNYDISENITLTSITSYMTQDRLYGEGITSPGGLFFVQHREEIEQWSEEIHVSGETGMADWILGFFYSRDTIDALNPVESPSAFGLGFGVNPVFWEYDQKTTAYAIFGSVDWTFSDAFTLVTGLRYTDEKVAFRGGTSAFVYTAPTPMMPNPNMLNTTGEVFRFLDGGGMADFPFTTTDNEFKDDNISFRVALEYRPDDDMMFYASVSSAFKSGGFFGDFTTEQGELEPFNSETILAYEGGVKLTTADGRVQMNGSVFYYDYEDIQTVVPAPFGFKLDNVEEAEVIGIDLDITARPVEGLDLILGMGWLNTETTSSMFPTLDKNKLPNAPELQVNGLVRYEIPLVDQFRLAVQGNFKYSDNKFTEATNTGLNFAADYIVFNGSLTLIPDSGEWDLTVWGKNLGDEEYFEEVFYSDVVFTVFNFPAPPRTFGATFNYRF